MSGYKPILSFLPFIVVILYYACICSSLPTRSRTDFRTPRIVNGNPAEANDWTEENTKIGRKPFNLRTTTSKPNLQPDRSDQLENDNDRKKPAFRATTVKPEKNAFKKQQDEKTITSTETTGTLRLPSRLTKLQIIKTIKGNIDESSLMKDEETQEKSKHRFSLQKEEVSPIPSPILVENKSIADVENDSKELEVELHNGEEIGIEEETTLGDDNGTEIEETVDDETKIQREKETEKEETEAGFPIENADHSEEKLKKEVNSSEEDDRSSEEFKEKEEVTGKEKDIKSSQESEENPKEATESEEDSNAEQDSLKQEVETTFISVNEKDSNEFSEQEKENGEKEEIGETEYESMGEEVVGDGEFEETNSNAEYRPFNISDPKKLQELLKKALEEISRRRLQFEMSKQETGNKKLDKPNHDYTIQEFTQEVMRLGFSSKQLSLMKQCNQESSEVLDKTMMMEEGDKNAIHRIVQRAWRTLLTNDEKRYQHVKEETSRGISDLLENERRKALQLREETEEELSML